MRKSKPKIQTGNQRNPYGKDQSQNIHFLINQIPKKNYENLYFLSNNTASYDDLLIYCEWLYNEGLKYYSLENEQFKESDNLLDLVLFLEKKVLQSVCKINVFDSQTVYDLNMEYLNTDLDENLKIGISKCISQIYQPDSGALFDYPDIEYIIGNLDMDFNVDDSDDFGYTPEQKSQFITVTQKYEKLYDKYLIEKFNNDIKYKGSDKEIYDIIINILSFDESHVLYNNVFSLEDTHPFESVFIASIRNDDETITGIFDASVDTRCQILGEVDVDFIAQYYTVKNGKIHPSVSDTQIKRIKKYEKDISKLCEILNKN